MDEELASLVFKQGLSAAELAALEAAKLRAMRKVQYAPGPKMLRISKIACDKLPDADKGVGGGSTQPED